jgi:hypothetical protein
MAAQRSPDVAPRSVLSGIWLLCVTIGDVILLGDRPMDVQL